MEAAMKVGELAKRTGLTVRTLHYYDEIGLLSPTRRTFSGHRLYGEEEIRRLQQIVSLRHLGLSLKEVKECLTRPEYSLERVLELQIDRIQQRIDRLERLRDLIRYLHVRLDSTEGVSVDDLTRTIEVTMNFEKYYTPEQMAQLKARREELGDERMQQAQQEWTELFAAYQNAMEEGLDPASEEVKALAQKSARLIEEFTGGDAGILASLTNMYRSEGTENVMSAHGMQTAPGLWEYMGKARAALEESG